MCLNFEKNYLSKFHSNPTKSGTPLVFIYNNDNKKNSWQSCPLQAKSEITPLEVSQVSI